MVITGGCHCGNVRYVIEQDELRDIANCHCSICRKVTGGAFVTWATVPKEAFRWVAMPPRVYTSPPECERYFCPRCGAHLALHTPLAPATIDVTVATLDDPHRFPPNRHIWVGSKLRWFTPNDGLPEEAEEVL